MDARRSISYETMVHAQEVGLEINCNYHGEYGEYAFGNAGCTAQDNTCVFVTNIPEEATTNDIFAAITEGKIFNFSQITPKPQHPMAAAYITFHESNAARKFLRRSLTNEGIIVAGKRVQVRMNKNRVKPRIGYESCQSRVILIQGPQEVISMDDLEHYLH